MPMKPKCHVLGWTLISLVALAAVGPQAGCASERKVSDFCFLQVSDSHLSPWPAHAPDPFDRDASTPTLQWMCQEAAKPQVLKPANLTVPPPAFVLATGDVTEYGVISRTFEDVLRAFEPLKVPVYITCGNHDNTWTSMLHVMWERYKGDHYSFDKSGCHFACLDTATPQEPLPSLEQRTLTWLTNDLKKVRVGTPVFLFCHHPLSTTEFAQPFEPLRLLEVIRGHNVVLLLMGHGHGVRHERWGTLDSVMGGSTYGDDAGYNIVAVTGGTLRVVYRFQNEAKPMHVLIEKPIAMPKTASVELLKPTGMPTISGPALRVAVRVVGGTAGRVIATIDGHGENTKDLAGGADGTFTGEIPTTNLMAGAHFLRVTAEVGDLKLDRALSLIVAPSNDTLDENRVILPAGMKAQPILQGDRIILATTAGEIVQMPVGGSRGQVKRIIDVGCPVLHAPALVDRTLYFGAADKTVYAVALTGKLQWKRPINGCAYGTPALDEQYVYVGDLEGFVHAIHRKTGQIRWSKPHAQFSIEQPLVLHENVLYFGAWDGFVYAVNAGDGSLRWKTQGPAGHTDAGKKNRYYSPADCPGVVIGDRLFFTDRAYQLGSYSLAGQYLGGIAAGVAGIGLTEDGKGLYARGLTKGLTRYDGEGKRLWSVPVALGRFPIPPLEVAGQVYVCSNRGQLSAHDSHDGHTLWEYQVTPNLPVMAPLNADRRGRVVVAAMDGSVTTVWPARGKRG